MPAASRNSIGGGRGFGINDDVDILTEVLKRLDGRSVCVAACVCRQWSSIARKDSVWEELCFRHVSPGVRPVVVALGGYKRLYMVCVRPLLKRMTLARPDEVQLSLSLFCVHYYETLAGSGPPSSLMFLCNPVNV
ncbi:unnamed protein product [Linum tenue]|uniref:F-box domain-containing protein n=1 Tax=Linum tenue TaxID=586396 RepID=A0AAV0LCB0_9ROSI|nr:unnamed protein product [Linum tenue]